MQSSRHRDGRVGGGNTWNNCETHQVVEQSRADKAMMRAAADSGLGQVAAGTVLSAVSKLSPTAEETEVQGHTAGKSGPEVRQLSHRARPFAVKIKCLGLGICWFYCLLLAPARNSPPGRVMRSWPRELAQSNGDGSQDLCWEC